MKPLESGPFNFVSKPTIVTFEFKSQEFESFLFIVKVQFPFIADDHFHITFLLVQSSIF